MGIEITNAELKVEGDFDSQFHGTDGQPVDGLRGILSIVKKNDEELKPIATGFFITMNGLFVTAKHTFLEKGLEQTDLAGMEVNRATGKVTIRPVVAFLLHPTADIALGILKPELNHVNSILTLTAKHPSIGDRVKTWSFPNPTVEEIDEKRFKINFVFTDHAGNITQHYPSGRDSSFLTSNCFEVEMDIFPGSSGGPVSSGDGVFGVNSTGYTFTDGGPPVGFVTSIHPLFDFGVPAHYFPEIKTKSEFIGIGELMHRRIVSLKEIDQVEFTGMPDTEAS